MDISANYSWIAPLATFVGLVIAVVLGYRRRHYNYSRGERHAVVSGAAVVDASVGTDLVREVRRVAAAAEEVRDMLKRSSDEAEIERRARQRAADIAARRQRQGE